MSVQDFLSTSTTNQSRFCHKGMPHIPYLEDAYMCVCFIVQYNSKPKSARESMDTEIKKALQHARVS